MQTNVHCISLRVVKHSDTTSIATVWSRELGRLSIALPAGSTREAQRRRALMMPFSLFEGVVNVKQGRDLVRISDVRPWGIGNVAAIDPLKGVVAMFLADFLCCVLRESQADVPLSDFIFKSAEQLAQAKGTTLGNFHLWMLCRLGQFLGITPDTATYCKGRYFDMREGVFTITPPLHRNYLEPTASAYLLLLCRADYEQLHHLRLNRALRNRILDTILEYYSLHHTPCTNIPSLQIVRAVLSD